MEGYVSDNCSRLRHRHAKSSSPSFQEAPLPFPSFAMRIGGYLWRCFGRSRHGSPHPTACSSSIIAARRHSSIAFITGIDYSSSPAQPHAAFDSDDDEETHEQNATTTKKKKLTELTGEGVGVLIYPSLLLTTHNTIPSIASIQNAAFSLRYSNNSLSVLHRKFLPHLFFATDADLNVTVVACEYVSGEMQPMGLDAASATDLRSGQKVYIMGMDENHLKTKMERCKKGKGNREEEEEEEEEEERSEGIMATTSEKCRKRCRIALGTGYVVGGGGGSSGEVEIRAAAETEEGTRTWWAEGSPGFDESGAFAFVVTGHGGGGGGAASFRPSPAAHLRAATVPLIHRWLEPHWQANKQKQSSPNPNPPLHPRPSPASHPAATYIRIADFSVFPSAVPCHKPPRSILRSRHRLPPSSFNQMPNPNSDPNPNNPNSSSTNPLPDTNSLALHPRNVCPPLHVANNKVPSLHKKISAAIHSSDYDSTSKPSPRQQTSARNTNPSPRIHRPTSARNIHTNCPRILQPSLAANVQMERNTGSDKSMANRSVKPCVRRSDHRHHHHRRSVVDGDHTSTQLKMTDLKEELHH